MIKEEILNKILEAGENHIATSDVTPIRADAFDLSNEEKIERIARHFEQIMLTLGLDLADDSLRGTPLRVAKMYVEEIFSGLDPKNAPQPALFENKYAYQQMLVEKDVKLHSVCEHHFVPIIGKAHVAYISAGNVIGLSKINRIVKYFARRPQVQERLTTEIAARLQEVLRTEDVAVVIDAKHYCVAMRGVEDDSSSTITAEYRGKFLEEQTRTEFLRYLEIQ